MKRVHPNSKASHIRRMINEMGNGARTKDIISALAKSGIHVSDQQVSNERARFKDDEIKVSEIKNLRNYLMSQACTIPRLKRILNALEELSN